MIAPSFLLPTGLGGRFLLAFRAMSALSAFAALAGLVVLFLAGRCAPEDTIMPLIIGSLSLSVIAAANLFGSVLIIWLLVGRDIVWRLTRLGSAMAAIAAGRLDVAIGDRGADEIGAMGRAVEAFRLVAIERVAQPSERLVEVEDRIVRFARNEAALREIFDSLHQGVAIFDRNLTLVAWNQPFRDLLKLPDVFLESRPSFDDFYRLLGWRGELGCARCAIRKTRIGFGLN